MPTCPVAGRSLASHGADVMLITAPHLPSIVPLAIDTGRGKLSAQLDLRDAAARETLRELVRGTDIFLQGYRPGAIARHGFSPEELAELKLTRFGGAPHTFAGGFSHGQNPPALLA
jgi:crotonobetainyl-CoA:carnitine CoA-transferase CaiB-like acyl-CoA transferase